MSHSLSHVASSIQPLTLIGGIAGLLCYAVTVRRNADGLWRVRRSVSFTIGVLAMLAITCGPAEYYGQRLFWVWLSQMMALLLVVPFFLMAGQPIALAGLRSEDSRLVRVLRSHAGRACTSPVVGPALIPLSCVLVLFGAVPGWSVHFVPVTWMVQLLVLVVGCAIVLPLVTDADALNSLAPTSLAVGAAVAIGFVELLVDAVPGLVMRLSTHPVSTYFEHRKALSGQLSPLRDQQIAGAILWCAAELLDLPFLFLIFRRWVRADARDAAIEDALLDAATSQAARLNNGQTTDEPWFLNDPQLRGRITPERGQRR